ncbi:MAG: sugar phosphate isomerase/epimerase [Clostridia bacterium]|nr:sugar phosphate isomerase/epimerase [Clostridia bacterium]
MKDLNLSAQLYTLREYTKTEEDFKNTLYKIKEIGYQSFQHSGAGFSNPAFVAKCLKETGLVLSATHTSPDRLLKDLPAVIDEHKQWNCEFVGIGMMPEAYRENEQSVISFARQFSEVGQQLKESGLTLIYHNHHFEFMKYNGRLIMDILLEESDKRYFDFEIDTYWVQAGGANPVEWIYKVNNRMKYIHFKDMGINVSTQVFKPVGEGNLNWPAILKACRETDVRWCAVEQDICEGSPFDALKTSYDHLMNRYHFLGE